MARGRAPVDPGDAVVTADARSPRHGVCPGPVTLARFLVDDADVVTAAVVRAASTLRGVVGTATATVCCTDRVDSRQLLCVGDSSC